MINKDTKTNNIWMDIFFKKTDTQRYVPFNSSHSKRCKNNIPFTLARRICEVTKKRVDELQKVVYF